MSTKLHIRVINGQSFGFKPPISKKVVKVKFVCDGIVMSGGCDFDDVIKNDGQKIRFKFSNSDIMNSKLTILK